MRSCGSVFRLRFIAGLQYRAAAASGLVTQFVWGGMELLAFSAFARADAAALPMELSQIAAYLWLQQAFLALFMVTSWDPALSDLIETGAVAYELVRPVDPYPYWFCHLAAGRVARAALRCWPILLFAVLLPEPYGLTLPPSAAHFALFLLSAVLALAVVTAFLLLINLVVFHTLSARGPKLVLGSLADLLSGAIIPLPFFPDGLRQAVEYSPFGAMQNLPLRIYCGNLSTPEALQGVALQLVWLAALSLLGQRWMRSALRRVVIQGG